jgi:ABC-type antimicrobial peptide transport system permease subunit
VVGVVGDVQVAALDAESPPVVYLSVRQAAENRMMLVLKTGVEPASLTGQLRAIVRELDSGVPLYSVARIQDQLAASRAVFSRRLPMMLCGVFASAALALTLIAVYAVSVHEAWSRRREFGIRAALGATPVAIRRLLLGDAVLVSAAGVGLGIIGGIALSRAMTALLYGVGANDLRVYLAVSAVMLVTVLIASLAPAFRAGATNPGIIMRAE